MSEAVSTFAAAPAGMAGTVEALASCAASAGCEVWMYDAQSRELTELGSSKRCRCTASAARQLHDAMLRRQLHVIANPKTARGIPAAMAAGDSKHQAMALIPMWNGDDLLGIVCRRYSSARVARHSSDSQLVTALASLGSVAIAKAHALDQHAERERDNELLVRSIHVSGFEGDDSQMAALAEQAAAAVHAKCCGIWMHNSGHLRLIASHGVTPAALRGAQRLPIRTPFLDRVRIAGDHLQAWALDTLDAAVGTEFELLGFGSSVLVHPVYDDTGFVGMLVLDPGNAAATEREMTLLGIIAKQVAVTAQRARMTRAIAKRSRHLAHTPRLARALARQRDPEAVAQIASRELHEGFGYGRVSIALRDGDHMRIVANSGMLARSGTAVTRTPVIDRVAEVGRPYVSCSAGNADIIEQIEVGRSRVEDANAPAGCRSQLVVPITDGSSVCMGVIAVYERDPDGIGEDDLNLLQTIADQLAATLEQATLFESLERNWMRTVEALSTALEAKDAYTLDHAKSITDLSAAVGQRLGMRGDEIRDLKLGALLHDIGKIGVPGDILNKQGPLNDAEFETMKQHTIIGEQIIAPIEFLEGVRPMVLHEHERWDGRGYPHGLGGEDIPLGARIIFVCDAWHAMTSNRPYREALPIEEARNRLLAGSGTQFDPTVISAFFEVVDREPELAGIA
jgi:HD-GYP domain-containing protein (c-di-GMP phosphodiesterase class II)